MLIGETFNQNRFYGGIEDNYDYLFRRRSKEERQQKRTERKEKRAEKRQQKQDPTTGKRTHPLLGNFGLFDKNKKKRTATTSGTSGSSAKKEPGTASESTTSDEINKTTTGNALQDKSEANAEFGTLEMANLESKELDSKGKPKEAGFGPMLGFAFLGITILLAGVAIYKAGNKPLPNTSPLKVAA